VYGFLLVFFSNFVEIFDLEVYSDLETRKLIEIDTIRSGTHDFLLTFYSNHRPISHRFRDKRRFPSKIANLSHPPWIYSPRWRSYPWNWVSAQESEETRMMALPDGRKRFKIGIWRIDTIPDCDSLPASHPPTQPATLPYLVPHYATRCAGKNNKDDVIETQRWVPTLCFWRVKGLIAAMGCD